MNVLGNIIWFVFGGLFIALEYLVLGLLFFLTIIGIPFGIQCMKMVGLALWPFGKEVVNKPNQKSGCVYPVLTIVWILIGGIWICVEHLLLGVLFAITVVGIPFAIQHFKLAGLAIVPFGKEIRDKKKQ